MSSGDERLRDTAELRKEARSNRRSANGLRLLGAASVGFAVMDAVGCIATHSFTGPAAGTEFFSAYVAYNCISYGSDVKRRADIIDAEVLRRESAELAEVRAVAQEAAPEA